MIVREDAFREEYMLQFCGVGEGRGGVGRGVLRSVIGKTESGGGIRSNPFIGCT